jgi:hypothetical protein
LVHFSPFLVFCTKKTLATLVKTTDVYLKRDYPRHSISGWQKPFSVSTEKKLENLLIRLKQFGDFLLNTPGLRLGDQFVIQLLIPIWIAVNFLKFHSLIFTPIVTFRIFSRYCDFDSSEARSRNTVFKVRSTRWNMLSHMTNWQGQFGYVRLV